jgi:hypothetical protein
MGHRRWLVGTAMIVLAAAVAFAGGFVGIVTLVVVAVVVPTAVVLTLWFLAGPSHGGPRPTKEVGGP